MIHSRPDRYHHVVWNVQILAFDEMEVLDYAGPYEVFTVAGQLSSNNDYRVASVGVTPQPVGRGGFTVLPDFRLDNAPAADIIIVPGGRGTRGLTHDERLLTWLRERADALLLTVCTGALVAAAAGLLHNREATTHHDAFDELAALSPTTTILRGQRFVRCAERIYTSAGVSAGIDLALAVVESLSGPVLRDLVETEMEWLWPRQPDTAN